MQDIFLRNTMMWDTSGDEALNGAHIAVFGVGGVGGYTVEALVRAGVGSITVIDGDTVDISNINRQIIATQNTIGLKKVDVIKERILSINPKCNVTAIHMFYLPENAHEIDFSTFNYVVDAVDTVSAKAEIAYRASVAGVLCISAMGCGNKLDPTKFCVTDIFKTDTDPLARAMRRVLREKGVKKLKVVYSTEPALKPLQLSAENTEAQPPLPYENSGEKTASPKPKRQTPGSVSFVPSVAGLIIAGTVVRDIVGI